MYFKDPKNYLHFLSDEDIANGGMALLPSDCVEITDAEAASIREAQLADVPVPVPQEVTRFQARAALYQSGLLEAVEAEIAKPETAMMLKLAWQDAQTFKRESQFVAGMAQALGLSAQQLDDLFTAASAIE